MHYVTAHCELCGTELDPPDHDGFDYVYFCDPCDVEYTHQDQYPFTRYVFEKKDGDDEGKN